MNPTQLAPDRIRKGERTRTRILGAAADVLARKGYAAATLTEIAAVAKMQAGSLYYHFDSKDAIVEEVLRVGIDHARDAIRSALSAAGDDASGHGRLMAAVVAYVTAIIIDSLNQIVEMILSTALRSLNRIYPLTPGEPRSLGPGQLQVVEDSEYKYVIDIKAGDHEFPVVVATRTQGE